MIRHFAVNFLFFSFIAWLIVRISVTVMGNLIGYVTGEDLPLGSHWMNWLCLGLGFVGSIIYLVATHKKVEDWGRY